MEKIDVTPLAEHDFAVAVTEGVETTHHTIHVTEGFRDDLAIADLDEAELAREAVAYLLERTPATAIDSTIDLDHLSYRDQGFFPELKARLNA